MCPVQVGTCISQLRIYMGECVGDWGTGTLKESHDESCD